MLTLEKLKAGGIVAVRDELLLMKTLGKPVIRTESGDPSFDTPEHILNAFKDALDCGKTHYAPGCGVPELVAAIEDKVTTQNKLKLGDGGVIVTNGGMHGLYVAMHSACHKQDTIAIQRPFWTEISDIALNAARRDCYNAARPVESLERTIQDTRLAAVVINSPHNPTGLVYSRDTLQALVDLCVKHNLIIITDEAYEDTIYEGEHVSPASLIGNYRNYASVFSFSKSHAMSGIRVGYIVTGDETIYKRCVKLIRLTTNGVATPNQYAATQALLGPQTHTYKFTVEYKLRRDAMVACLSAVPWLEPIKPAGSLYVWCRLPGDTSAKHVTMALTKLGIGSAPGDVFGQSNYIRFSFANCDLEDIETLYATLTILREPPE